MNIEEVLEKFAKTGIIPRIVTLKTRTHQELRAKSVFSGQRCPHRNVSKIAYRRGIIGASYEFAVNLQAIIEGDCYNSSGQFIAFKAYDLWEGNGLHVGPYIVEHKFTHRKYLCFQQLEDLPNDPLPTPYYMNAKREVVGYSDLIPYLPKPKNYGFQGLNVPVKYSIFKLSSILEIESYGETYKFSDEEF